MNEQTQNTGTQNQKTEPPKKEEGAHMTTKSMQMSRSSLTHSPAKHKKIIDAEEEQRRKSLDDSERLNVDCRVSADADILNLINAAKIQNQIGMLMETTAKAARSILLRAADSIGCTESAFDTASMEIHLSFHEPEMLTQICQTEEEHGKN